MAAKIDVSLCDRCGTCIAVCPANALILLPEALVVDGNRCTDCGNCVKICPFGALRLSHE
jgi:anaerobic carbon-monoxide dehydrogenase iron sulfur subunit